MRILKQNIKKHGKVEILKGKPRIIFEELVQEHMDLSMLLLKVKGGDVLPIKVYHPQKKEKHYDTLKCIESYY